MREVVKSGVSSTEIELINTQDSYTNVLNVNTPLQAVLKAYEAAAKAKDIVEDVTHYKHLRVNI